PPTSHPAPRATPRALQGNRLLRQPAFWLVTISFTLVSGSFVGVLTHQVVFLKDSGMNQVTAAGTLGMVAGMGIAGKLLAGYLSDRLSRLWLAGLIAVLQAAGLLVLMSSQTQQAVWVFVMVFGLAVGAVPVMRPLLLSDFFGSDAFGANYGWMMLFSSLGAATGPPFAGYIYDTTGSYTGAFTTFVAAYVASVLCLVLARRLRPSQEGLRPA
ncbi:MAG: MFS transporter, partial [Dehalococcoidia bacterium]